MNRLTSTIDKMAAQWILKYIDSFFRYSGKSRIRRKELLVFTNQLDTEEFCCHRRT